ncbi:ATP-binding protein [Desulfopila sp. IMCC35006]|uniref:ATP-binding protein n=1 Tax=Desulfopila sp. IMCC35006 TaxID=2569542 RepID=UPI0010ACD4E7|nr:ATP-binding protein [Desulfopila sp. IMCC35006]TKB24222.1 ATP-binding protein [Desulfopila sp. IMCC35006]
MSIATSLVDYGGARGSNAGDQFHELWALLHVLELLKPDTDLLAVGVEGVRTETSSQTADNPTWDGVDCALYYGGTSLETADRVEFVQLKYSAANPEKKWSVARLSENTAKKTNNSGIRRLADDFIDARLRMKQGAQLSIRFVSNQNISDELKTLIGTRWKGSLKKAQLDPSTKSGLQELIKASGISENEFQDFLSALDFSECGTQSRFSVKEKVVDSVASLLGNDVSSEVRELQIRTRELMLPERAGEVVTEKDLLVVWFGLCGRDGLFPCPPDIQSPQKVIEREAVTDVVNLLTKGERLVLIHGAGGCGKTTLMHQITDRLPQGSVTAYFDCFGAGRYLQTDDKRHLPENAFLQLTNDLAISLQLPLFIPRNQKNPATIKLFLQRLHAAGEALHRLSPQGLLLILIDAADNSVAAAQNMMPSETSFVHELFGAGLERLPSNIKFIASCRTDPARRKSIKLPAETPEALCPPFSLQETTQHLEATFSDLPANLVEQFHELSAGNPRVQAYAIAAAEGEVSRLLAGLLPGGKSLADVLKEQFKTALQKLGYPQKFDNLIDTLAFLPAPINVSALARITDTSEDIVRDFATDLWPGLRLKENEITIADEDFEAFIKNKGSANRNAVTTNIAADFYKTFQLDHYSSLHVTDALITAGRAKDILFVIESDSQVAAISDPIVRRQVQVRRLKLSLAACHEAGTTTDALKTVLFSAEAEHDDSTLNEVLENELDLSVEFAGSSLRRTILLDPERIESQGSFLAQDAVRAIRSGDRVTAREQLYFHEAWLKRRRTVQNKEMNDWKVTDSDIAARVETILELGGPKAGIHELLRWTPRDVAIRVAIILVPQLIAAGKSEYLKILLKDRLPRSPWDLLLWVPLAMAGESIDSAAIERSLKYLKKRFIPDINTISASHSDEGWQQTLLDILITACELAFKIGVDTQIVLSTVNLILSALEGEKKRHLYLFDVCRIDALFRCWLLREMINGTTTKAEDFIAYTTSLNPEPKPIQQEKGKGAKTGKRKQQTDNRDIEKIHKKLKALYPIYYTRLEILSCAKKGHQIEEKQLDSLNIASNLYEFDHDHESSKLRTVAAQSVMGLLIVEGIKAVDLANRANLLSKGRYSDSFASNRLKLWSRMRLRNAESEIIVEQIANAADDIKKLREASSSKLEALIRFCRLVLPISRDDAAALFNDAVMIAKEIDREAFDQIDFLSVMADRADLSAQQDGRTIASDIFTFISGAAERLSGYDHFPWNSAVHALTCVDNKAALAAICRWDDNGTVYLHETLSQCLLTALKRENISLEVASSLALLIGGSSGDLWQELVCRAITNPLHNKEVIEGLAKEALLLTSQESRLKLGGEIVGRIPEESMHVGKWIAHLRNTVEFLKKANNGISDESVTQYDNSAYRNSDYQPPPEFEFDPQGKIFSTPESIAEVLQAAAASGLRHNDRELLRKMREATSNLRNRISFLNALANIPDEALWEHTRIDMLLETIGAWKGTPAVDHWCSETLPSILIENFCGAARYLKEEESALYQMFDYAGLDDKGRLNTILAGVSTAGEGLGSRALFAIAEEIARTLEGKEAGNFLVWYSERLRNRIPAEEHTILASDDIPSDTTEAIARFLFALMSDIDTRVRWKAAHVLRQLAQHGCLDIITAAIDQSSRQLDISFRDPTAPFYFLAAKLWLMISLCRISSETPSALVSHKEQILNIATSSELPHVAIREYAKRTLLQLAASGVIALTASEKDQLDKINAAIKGKTKRGRDSFRSFGRVREGKRRFRFDEMDTLPYWYEDILRIFPTISQEQVLTIGENWIIDKWNATDEANYWDREPRKARYDQRKYHLWSHSHHSRPTIERYGTHLEWNAMYCIVGELLTTHPVSSDEDGEWGSFSYWLSHVLLTDNPAWLSDHRGPTPLELRFWKDDPRTDKGWMQNINRVELLSEMGLPAPNREGWIVVSGSCTTHYKKRVEQIRINSALVSPETASALARALQTESDVWGLRLPYEKSDYQINSKPFRLQGWLSYLEGDLRFDDNDPFRYEVGQIRVVPGHKLKKTLKLAREATDHLSWVSSYTGEAAFNYEAWCDEPSPDDDYYPRRNRSSGWRLWAKIDKVRDFLAIDRSDLICEVQIERELRKEYGRAHESAEKEKKHHKIILLRSDGSIADAKGHIGNW